MKNCGAVTKVSNAVGFVAGYIYGLSGLGQAVLDIGSGENRNHARCTAGRVRVDACQPRVRVRAPSENEVRHTWQAQIFQVRARSRDEPGIFTALDRQPQHVWRNHHARVSVPGVWG